MTGRLVLALAFSLAACDRLPHEDASSSASASESRSSDPPAGERTEAQCTRDDECVLLPYALTCCIECPPAPPFEPAPITTYDAMLIENENECAANYRPCPEVRCERVPASCVAHAACVDGRCVAVSTGCELPTS